MKIFLLSASALAPTLLMLLIMLLSLVPTLAVTRLWKMFIALSGLAVVFALVAVFSAQSQSLPIFQLWLSISSFGTCLALLVQLLGTVIVVFSKRYL